MVGREHSRYREQNGPKFGGEKVKQSNYFSAARQNFLPDSNVL